MAAKNIAEVKSTTEQKCKNSDHGNIFLDTLNKMRINKKRCDFSLDVEGEIIQVHTLALQIASPYFAAMFECDMKEAKEGVVKLVDMDLIAVKIQELISDDQLSVKCEDNVYKAAINWLKYDIEERKVHLPELLNHIRLPLISTTFLQNHVAAEPLLAENLECNALLMKALFHKLTSVGEGKYLSDRSQIRKGIEYNKEIFHVFLVGGVYSTGFTSHNKCKVYDVSENKLIQISNMNEHRRYHSAIALNGVVYSMGGYNDNNNSRWRTAECYDPVNKRWNYIAPMSNGRHDFGICSYNDFVYVVGGFDTSTVECYNPATNKWGLCPHIPNEHSSYTRATLLENSIYS
uniref:BTB domain-containing protein n=1 Tax=Glossina brevipalpis TaxID=37001 RepID=A0A1A9WWN1_9MUSC